LYYFFVLGLESSKEQQNSFSQKRPEVCPGANLPLGGRNPVLCGEHYDSIGCPSGYLCVPGKVLLNLYFARLIKSTMPFNTKRRITKPSRDMTK